MTTSRFGNFARGIHGSGTEGSNPVPSSGESAKCSQTLGHRQTVLRLSGGSKYSNTCEAGRTSPVVQAVYLPVVALALPSGSPERAACNMACR